MSKSVFIVATYAKDGQKPELESWYDSQHIPDLLQVPGITGATRYDVTRIKMPGTLPTPDCLTIYEIDAPEPVAVIGELGKRAEAGQILFTDALDRDRTISFIATPVEGG